MLLSEITNDTQDEFVYGVVCDTPSFFPPPSLKRISFVLSAKDREIEDSVLDVTIAYKGAGVEVIWEVPEALEVETDEIIRKAERLDVSIALVPNSTYPSVEYVEKVSDFAKKFIGFSLMSKPIYPISDIVGGMLFQRLNGVFKLVDQEEVGKLLVGDRFNNDQSVMEPIICAVRDGLKECLGGEEELEFFLDAHIQHVFEMTENKVAELQSKI